MLGRRRHGRCRLLPPPQCLLRGRAIGRDLGRRNGRVDALLVVVRRRRGVFVVPRGRLVDRLRVVVGDVIVCSLNRGHDAGLARLQLVLHGRRRRARDRTGRALGQLGERQRIGHDRQPQRAARRRVTAAHLERQVDVAGEGASVEPDTRAVPLEVVRKYRLQGLELLIAGRDRLRVLFVSADRAFQERHVHVDVSRAARQAVAQFVDVCLRAGRDLERLVARDQLVVAARDQERRAGRRRGLGPPRCAGDDQRLEAWQAIGHRERAGAS